MIEDPVKIRPESRQKNYYTDKFEFATPVINPKQKAEHFFHWGLVFHAKGKPAEAYKYYEKSMIHHQLPLYFKQMGILHHEMGYFRDALKYLRTAVNIEREMNQLKEKEETEKEQEAMDYSAALQINFYNESPQEINYQYSAK